MRVDGILRERGSGSHWRIATPGFACETTNIQSNTRGGKLIGSSEVVVTIIYFRLSKVGQRSPALLARCGSRHSLDSGSTRPEPRQLKPSVTHRQLASAFIYSECPHHSPQRRRKERRCPLYHRRRYRKSWMVSPPSPHNSLIGRRLVVLETEYIGPTSTEHDAIRHPFSQKSFIHWPGRVLE